MARSKLLKEREQALIASLPECPSRSVATLLGISEVTLLNWVGRGLPRNQNGTYPWAKVRSWWLEDVANKAKPRLQKPNADGTTPDGTYEDQDLKYKALARKQRYELQAGKLIEKSDADKAYLSIAHTIRASLLALPDQIAAQLADLPARDVARVLRERMGWLCDQFRQGRVIISPEMQAEVDAVVAKHAATLPEFEMAAIPEDNIDDD